MFSTQNFIIYLLLCAGVTYLIRMIPLVLFRKKIENKFVLYFLYYVPYTVLSVITVPAIFYATSSYITAAIGFITAIIAALYKGSLVKVAALSCLSVLIAELIIKYL